MKDALMLLLVVAFFALCVAYVAWCDRIIGADPAEVPAEARTDVGENDVAGRAADDVPESVKGEVTAS